MHPTAQRDALTAARHRAFIAPRSARQLCRAGRVPDLSHRARRPEHARGAGVRLAGRADPDRRISCRAPGAMKARMCCRRWRCPASSPSMALQTGGIASFAAIWLVVVPLEAALSASRRVVALASGFRARGGGFFLMAAGWFGTLPVCAAGNRRAGGAQHRRGVALCDGARARRRIAGPRQLLRLLKAEEDRYRLLARNMTDVITRHRRNGAVRFVSPAAEPLFGMSPKRELHRPRPVRPRACRRPPGLSDGAGRCVVAGRSALGRIPHPVRYAGRRGEFHVAGNALPSAGSTTTRGEHGPSAKSWRCSATSPSARRRRSRSTRRAQEADRANAAKTRFLATMSHELRTPLNADHRLLGHAGERRHDADRRQARAEYAKLIGDVRPSSAVGGERHSRTCRRSKTAISKFTPEPFVPGQVVDTCCDLDGAQGARRRHRPAGQDRQGPAGHRRRQARGDADHDQPDVQRAEVHAARRQGDGRRADRGPSASSTASTTPASASARRTCRVSAIRSFRCAPPMTARHDGTGLGLSIVKGLLDLHGGRSANPQPSGRGHPHRGEAAARLRKRARAQAAAAANCHRGSGKAGHS